MRKAPDRETWLRHRPIAQDETGRKYYILGGSAGSATLFAQIENAPSTEPSDPGEEAAAKKKEEDVAADPSAVAAPGPEPSAAADDKDAPATPKPSEETPAKREKEDAASIAAAARAKVASEREAHAALAAEADFGGWPTRWGMFEVGPKLKALKEWADDDPRNPAAQGERRIKSIACLLYTSPSPRDATLSRMPSSA